MCVCVCVCVYLCVCVYTCWSVCVCVSATSGGGRVLGLQSFLEAAEQQAVPSVLLVLAAVELPLHLEAPVHHEPRVENREAVASDVQLTGLKERTEERAEEMDEEGPGCEGVYEPCVCVRPSTCVGVCRSVCVCVLLILGSVLVMCVCY